MAWVNTSYGSLMNSSQENTGFWFTAYNSTPISGDLLSRSQYVLSLQCLLAPMIAISVVGIWNNIVNIYTFLRMGLEDSVTIVFFILAIADLIILFAQMARVHCLLLFMLEGVVPLLELDPFLVTVFCVIVDRFFKDIAVFSIAFLGIQRSLCVLMPLHFKGLFTRFRTCVILLVIWAYAMICFVTNVSSYYIQRITIPGTNLTMYILRTRPFVQMSNTFLNIVNGICLNVLCQVTVFCCVVIMAYELNKSVKFRQTSTVVSFKSVQHATGRDPLESEQTKTSDKKASAKLMTNSKEKQAITQVTILCTIFLITNCPQVITSVAEEIVPEIAVFRRYHYVFSTIFNLRLTIESINSAVNFFIYYKYNTKFRQFCFLHTKQ